MVYLFMPFLMTLDDLEGHSPDEDLLNTIQRTFVRQFARFQMTRRIAQSLGDS